MVNISKFGSEKIILDAEGKLKFRRCMNDECTETKDFSPEECGFVKALDVKVIQKLTYFSERSFAEKTAYFVLTFRCKMPKDRILEFCYFKYEPKAMGNVCVRDFGIEQYTCQTINLLNEETRKYYGIKQVGRRRITENQAREMIRNKECLPEIANESGEVGQTIAY